MDIAQLMSNYSLNGNSQISSDMRSLESLKRVDNLHQKHEQLKASAKNFEGIFIHQVLKQMQETIENASFDPDDNAGKQVHGMYTSFLADAVSQQGGFGMWEEIYEQMARMEGLDPEHTITETQLDESV